MSAPRRLCCWVVGVVVSVSAAAYADPIAITSGTLIGNRQQVRMTATGERGFAIDATGGGVSSGIIAPADCPPCFPGETISLEVRFSGGDFLGTVSLDGETFPVGGFSDEDGSAVAVFSGAAQLPPFDGLPETTASGQFRFDGLLVFPQTPGPSRPSAQLIGQGTATIFLARGALDEGWLFRSLRYDFEPVPEPASLLLLATGLTGLVLRRIRRAERH